MAIHFIRHGLKPTKFLLYGTMIAWGLHALADQYPPPPPRDGGYKYKVFRELGKTAVVQKRPILVPVID
jgi:hypothetical protein